MGCGRRAGGNGCPAGRRCIGQGRQAVLGPGPILNQSRNIRKVALLRIFLNYFGDRAIQADDQAISRYTHACLDSRKPKRSIKKGPVSNDADLRLGHDPFILRHGGGRSFLESSIWLKSMTIGEWRRRSPPYREWGDHERTTSERQLKSALFGPLPNFSISDWNCWVACGFRSL